jgi:hypothetical protein
MKKTTKKAPAPKPTKTPAFWLVWRENGGNPTKKHATEDAARAEAERLAKKHPAVHFFVLPALQFARTIVTEPTWLDAPPVKPDDAVSITFTWPTDDRF